MFSIHFYNQHTYHNNAPFGQIIIRKVVYQGIYNVNKENNTLNQKSQVKHC